MRSAVWRAILAYDGRVRHAAASRREEKAANQLASVRARVLAGLRCAVALDIETLLGPDGDGSDAAWSCGNAQSTQGFVVVRNDRRLGARSVTVDLDAAALRCRYQGCHTSVEDAPERDSLTIEIERDGSTFCLWNSGLPRRFETAGVLSGFLLAPLLRAA